MDRIMVIDVQNSIAPEVHSLSLYILPVRRLFDPIGNFNLILSIERTTDEERVLRAASIFHIIPDDYPPRRMRGISRSR